MSIFERLAKVGKHNSPTEHFYCPPQLTRLSPGLEYPFDPNKPQILAIFFPEEAHQPSMVVTVSNKIEAITWLNNKLWQRPETWMKQIATAIHWHFEFGEPVHVGLGNRLLRLHQLRQLYQRKDEIRQPLNINSVEIMLNQMYPIKPRILLNGFQNAQRESV
jgi:hypothetical protein